MHETEEQIEKIGVEKSLAFLQDADLVLAVFDVSRPLEADDENLLSRLPKDRTIAVCNKTDLGKQWNIEDYGFADIVEISAKMLDGMELLETAVEKFASRQATPAEDGMIANERQRVCLQDAITAVQESLDALQMGLAYDAVTVSLEGAADALLQLTGERITDAVVDAVFTRFCVGK